jgi:hypothetical protein
MYLYGKRKTNDGEWTRLDMASCLQAYSVSLTDHLQQIFLESLLSLCFLSRLKIHQREGEKNSTDDFYDSIRNRTGSLLYLVSLYREQVRITLRVCSSSESSLTLIWYCSWKVNIFMPKE